MQLYDHFVYYKKYMLFTDYKKQYLIYALKHLSSFIFLVRSSIVSVFCIP